MGWKNTFIVTDSAYEKERKKSEKLHSSISYICCLCFHYAFFFLASLWKLEIRFSRSLSPSLCSHFQSKDEQKRSQNRSVCLFAFAWIRSQRQKRIVSSSKVSLAPSPKHQDVFSIIKALFFIKQQKLKDMNWEKATQLLIFSLPFLLSPPAFDSPEKKTFQQFSIFVHYVLLSFFCCVIVSLSSVTNTKACKINEKSISEYDSDMENLQMRRLF